MSTAPIAQGPVDVTVGRRVLDPCCGGRMMWLNKQHPDVVFGDRRSETLTVTERYPATPAA